MKVSIKHFSFENHQLGDTPHIKTIVEIETGILGAAHSKGTPISDVYFAPMSQTLTVMLDSLPTRIDFDPGFDDIWLLGDIESNASPEPYGLIINNRQEQPYTIWQKAGTAPAHAEANKK